MYFIKFFIDQTFLVPLAVGMVIVNILLFFIFILVSSLFFKRIILSTEVAEKIRENARKEAENLVVQSRQEAVAYVLKINEDVAKILEDLRIASLDTQRKVEKTYELSLAHDTEQIRKGAQDLLRSYEEAGMAAKSAYQKSADAIDIAVIRQTQDAMIKFQKVLEDEATRFRVSAEELFHGWQKQASQEIDAYKQASFKKVEQALYQVIALISKEVIGRGLDLDGQQELVMRALEEAKKEGFFKQ